MAELRRGARPAIEATAAAVIIGAMDASMMETFAAKECHPKSAQRTMAAGVQR